MPTMIDTATEPCKHLREGGTRVENGYSMYCLKCGHKWFKEDEPLTEDEKADSDRFDSAIKSGFI